MLLLLASWLPDPSKVALRDKWSLVRVNPKHVQAFSLWVNLLFTTPPAPLILFQGFHSSIPLLGVRLWHPLSWWIFQWLQTDTIGGGPVVAQRKQIRRVTMRMQVPSLASLRVKARHCRELWCRSQGQLGSGFAVAVVQAGGYSSNSTPSLGTSICWSVALKSKNKTKPKNQPK